MSYQPFCSTEIVFVTRQELLERLLEVENNVVLVMSRSASKRWEFDSFIDKLSAKLKRDNYKFVWIEEIASNPTQEDLVNALRQICHDKVRTIIAIGGGSAIDLAKGLSTFANHHHKDNIDIVSESIKSKSYMENTYADIIAVPTTSGTGSEVTQWATIWDKDKKLKYSLDTPLLQPKLAIIVPELTTSISNYTTLSTGFDAMCQAIEAYWSKHTTPIVQEIAYRAVQLFLENLRKAVEDPKNLEVRENLARGSVLAGIAFSKTRTTACHSISYPLTMFHDIPHGIAATLTLDGVAKRNKGYFPNDERLFELFKYHDGIKHWINRTCEGVFEMNLGYFGVKEVDLPKIVDNAFTASRMDNNPRELTRNDVLQILSEILT